MGFKGTTRTPHSNQWARYREVKFSLKMAKVRTANSIVFVNIDVDRFQESLGYVDTLAWFTWVII
jgi:hypothetical protein